MALCHFTKAVLEHKSCSMGLLMSLYPSSVFERDHQQEHHVEEHRRRRGLKHVATKKIRRS